MRSAAQRGAPRPGRGRCRGFWRVALVGLGAGVFWTQAAGQEAPVHDRRSLLPGLEWAQWDGGELCRSGDPTIAVLIVDPERYRFQVLHYREQGESVPLDLKAWQEKSLALALFNAGQYYPDYSYMGLLIHRGKPIRARLHPSFQGIFLAEPLDGRPPLARIVDLVFDTFDAANPRYGEAAQSFMLLDRSGTIRVQRTQNVAPRTAVAEGKDQKVWVFVARGGYTLWEFAQLIKAGPFPIHQVLSMDGGEEAQMLVTGPGFRYDSVSTPPGAEAERGEPASWRRALPTVIGVLPRVGAPQGPR